VDIQETFLIEDLLYAMTSIEGVYIKRKQVQIGKNAFGSNTHNEENINLEYQIEPYLQQPSCDFSLQFLVNKMLPLCNNHDFIRSFVNVHSQFEFGLVSHALCGAIRVLLKEYLLLVT
jgi:gamma-tubulin complex component 2